MHMLTSPKVRNCWSLNCRICSNIRRQPDGLSAGNNPSSTRNSAKASQSVSLIGTAAYQADQRGEAPAPRMARKKSLDGSTTITSDLLRNVVR